MVNQKERPQERPQKFPMYDREALERRIMAAHGQATGGFAMGILFTTLAGIGVSALYLLSQKAPQTPIRQTPPIERTSTRSASQPPN